MTSTLIWMILTWKDWLKINRKICRKSKDFNSKSKILLWIWQWGLRLVKSIRISQWGQQLLAIAAKEDRLIIFSMRLINIKRRLNFWNLSCNLNIKSWAINKWKRIGKIGLMIILIIRLTLVTYFEIQVFYYVK